MNSVSPDCAVSLVGEKAATNSLRISDRNVLTEGKFTKVEFSIGTFRFILVLFNVGNGHHSKSII